MTTTKRRRRPGLAALVTLVTLPLGPGVAWALDTEVTATTAAQGYALRSPFGDPVLYRRRVMQTVGLGAYEKLDPTRPDGPQFLMKLRLRLDSDVGIDPAETSFRRADQSSRFVPGLVEAPVDLMYGYIEGRHLAGGWLGVRLGRQYVSDALGWWSFDGALVRAQAPYVAAEVYGGFEQRGGLPLSLGRYERGGVSRGDRTGLEGAPDAVPTFLEAGRAPAYGFALETTTVAWVHARVDYRRVSNTGTVTTSYLPGPDGQARSYGETRVSSERLGAAVDATAGDLGSGRAGLVYDFYGQLVSSAYASLDGYLGRRLTVGADYDFFKPTFDADSIWNWFTQTPITSLTGRANLSLGERVDVALNAGVRWWQTDDDPARPSLLPARTAASSEAQADPAASHPTRLTDLLGSLYGRYRLGSLRTSLRGVLETGARGRREGVDVAGERAFRGGRYGVSLRGSLFDWRDDLRPDRSATSVGYVVGASWRPGPATDVMVEWEHNANRLVGQRYRVLAVVNLVLNR